MKRRKFIHSAAIASALPLTLADAQPSGLSKANRELYELRTYEINFKGNQNILIDFLKNVLQPALKRKGVNHFMVFRELGDAEPVNLRVLISYKDCMAFLASQNLSDDPVFNAAADAYHAIPPDKALFTRYHSSLLLAFEGLPQMKEPIEGASLFELRTYEGYSEDAVRRKIKMFNEEEIELFMKVNLHPLFFGDMIIGPYRPALVYMLNFKDMAEHDASWEKFLSHPDWKAMSAKVEYANTVSNIRKVFLKPV